MMNLPNLISMGRILLIPLFLYVFWSASPASIPWAMLIMALAGISDIADGYLARKYNQITTMGKILDPLADKLMILSALTSLYLIGLIPIWIFLLVIVKEVVLIVGSGFVVLKRSYDVSANLGGKLATVTIYSAIFAVALRLPGKSFFLYLAGLMAFLSLFNYLYNYLQQSNRQTRY